MCLCVRESMCLIQLFHWHAHFCLTSQTAMISYSVWQTLLTVRSVHCKEVELILTFDISSPSTACFNSDSRYDHHWTQTSLWMFKRWFNKLSQTSPDTASWQTTTSIVRQVLHGIIMVNKSNMIQYSVITSTIVIHSSRDYEQRIFYFVNGSEIGGQKLEPKSNIFWVILKKKCIFLEMTRKELDFHPIFSQSDCISVNLRSIDKIKYLLFITFWWLLK